MRNPVRQTQPGPSLYVFINESVARFSFATFVFPWQASAFTIYVIAPCWASVPEPITGRWSKIEGLAAHTKAWGLPVRVVS